MAIAAAIGAYALAGYLAVSNHSAPRLDVFLAPIVLAGGAFFVLGGRMSYGVKAPLLIAACWLCCVLLCATGVVPGSEAGYLLVVIVAGFLMGPWAAVGAALMGSAAIVMPAILGSGDLSVRCLVEVWLCVALLWAAVGHLYATIVGTEEGAQAAWQFARESRERRGHLVSVVRSLEEATFRIARMNHELNEARLEAELARAQKTRFVATVSHEIRGSLNLILGFSRLMVLSPERYGVPLPPTYRADMDAVYRNSEHLASLIDDVIDLAQIQSERLPLVKDRIDLTSEVLVEAVEIIRPLAERKGLALVLGIPQKLPLILADPVRIRQVLLNLLVNAVRHTNSGEIAVNASLIDDEISVHVRDTGEGIDANDIPRLFQEFSRVGTAVADGQKTSGLGLSISKHLIGLHGGRMWVESATGAGTTVYFTLPLFGSSAALSAQGRATHRAQASTPETVLILHDDASLIKLLGRHIEDYRVVGVSKVGEVGALLRELHPRAIITSHGAVSQLQDTLDHMGADVPLITCNLDDRQAPNPLDSALTYLVKPVTPETLFAVMQKIRGESQTRVLLVDDDVDSVRLMTALLDALPHRHRILKAHSGMRAVEIMQQEIPDVVFMDLMMPQMSGEEVISHMQSDPRLSAVPIVVVSAMDATHGMAGLSTPFSLLCRRTIEVGSAVKCLRAMLEVLPPEYPPAWEQLPQPTSHGRSGATARA